MSKNAAIPNSYKFKFFNKDYKLAVWFLAPAIIVLLLFMFYPIAYVFVMSAYKTNRIGGLVSFIGFDNFINLFSDDKFIAIIIRTIVWTSLAVIAKTLAGLGIAMLFNREFPGRKISRTLIVIPWASSIPISVMIWEWTLNDNFGLLNHTLRTLGIWDTPPIWLAYPVPAFIATLVVDIWLGIPFMALVFLAGLQAMPKYLYEAAAVEGANSWQQFRHITLPLLKPILLIATLLSFLWTFNDFNVIYILTSGGPAGSTEILITYVYRTAFEYLNFGAGSATAVITFIILLFVSLLYAKFYFKTENR